MRRTGRYARLKVTVGALFGAARAILVKGTVKQKKRSPSPGGEGLRGN